MIKYIFQYLILCLLIFSIENTNAQWHKEYPKYTHPLTFSFLNPQNCWYAEKSGKLFHINIVEKTITQIAVLDHGISSINFVDSLNGFLLTYSPIKLLYSSDAGYNWKEVKLNIPDGSNSDFPSYFIDKNNWMMNGSLSYVFRTKDMGLSWEKVNIQNYGGSSQPTYEIKFCDKENGLLLITTTTGYPNFKTLTYLYQTNNSGKVWRSIKNISLIISFDILDSNHAAYSTSDKFNTTSNGWQSFESYNAPSYIRYINMVDSLTYYGISDNSIIRSVDGGKNWQHFSIAGFKIQEIKDFRMFDNKYGILIPEKNTRVTEIMITRNGGFNWDILEQFPTELYENLIGINFVDNINGIAISKTGSILETKDRGENWQIKYKNNLQSLDQVQILDSVTYYAYSSDTFSNYFFKTTDGGKSWENQKHESIDRMFFFNKKYGWLTTDYSYLLSTKDSGKTWQKIKTPVSFREIFYVDTLVGYFSKGWELWKTVNGGESFEFLSILQSQPNKFYFVNKDIGWCFMTGVISKTNNGGNELNVSSMPSGGSFYSIKILQNNLFALQSHNLIYSTDGGTKWSNSKILNEGDVNLEDIFVESTKNIWVVGNEGTIYNGSIDAESQSVPAKYSIKQNYPNPFNLSTVIEYEILEEIPVKIEVYDLLGQKVRTLVDDTKQPGIYKITFDGFDKFNRMLASGIYFYKFQAGKYFESKKMVLIK